MKHLMLLIRILTFTVCIFGWPLEVHAWRLSKHQSWYFSTMMIGIAFVVGYVFLCFSASKNPYKVSYFVTQYFFIVVAPVFLAAAIYTVLSILINILDVALIGVAASSRRDTTKPNNLLLGGLAFQVFTFFAFIVLSVSFAVKAKGNLFRPVRKSFYVAFAAAVLLLAETSEGPYGKLNTHEVYFVLLEFMPVVHAVWLPAVWHPGKCVPRATSSAITEVDVEK
ncbi:hypothetical protein GQ44DRAFT_744527 [Phaeosphaeriaceae sp. PMI808]|nr:hypothetical protein GQ44DRAFT_744527 [Phaeosphaeriaceae sp. PMI808]